MCGGFTDYTPIKNDVKQLAMSHKSDAESKLGLTFSLYKPVEFKSQVVAGTNYLVKVKVDNGKHIEVKIHKPLPCNGTQTHLMEANYL